MTTRSARSIPISRDTIGIAFILLSGTGVVFLPTTARLAFESGSNLLTVALARGVIATLILFVVALLAQQRLRLPRELFASSLIVGLAGTTFVFGMFGAILSIEISLAILILYLFPMVLAIYQHWRGTIRLQPLQWVCGLVALVGLGIIVGVRFGQSSLTGVSLAFLAMFASVVITLENVKVVECTGSLVSNLYMSLWGVVIFAIALLLAGKVMQPQTTTGWVGLFGNGIAYCVSWVAFFTGARILGAARASMITLIEPLLAALFAWIIFGETLTPAQWAGFALVLAALALFEKQARGQR